MAKASISETFNAPIKKVFQTITDYSHYPEFLSDVKRISIIDDTNPKAKLVEFELSLIKTFRYQVIMTEEPNHRLSWRFHSGDIFKTNTGQWTLKEIEPEKTLAEYSLEVGFGVFVPGMIANKLIEVSLPSMIKAFKERVEK